jgi:hypothetical protein
MHLLYSIVYAAHASGTHHKLALDALRHVEGTDSDLWQRLFLKHADLYLEGSKAPDKEFKDFKNHVLHTRDGYWGGAPEKVRSWYHHLVEALGQEDWQTAVYCAGVLSHYYTDPLHPFHTGQSEAENNVHRAVEWSISKAYDQLRAQGEREFPDMRIDVPAGPNWLALLVCAGADRANGYYEKLIAHYDIQRGVVDPPAGLDQVACRIIAELIRYATLSYAVVLARAIGESKAQAPSVSLAPATLLAAVKVPIRLLTRRIAGAQERRQIERIYDELISSGTVEKNLSEDDRTVRDLHAREVVAKRPPQPEPSRVFPFKPRPRIETRIDRTRAARMAAASAANNVIAFASKSDKATQAPPLQPRRARAGLSERLDKVTAMPPKGSARTPTPTTGTARLHLSLDQDVVHGPSIGPKTAERLYPHGIRTVQDLIKADPVVLAVLVNNRHITAEAISSWQDQARLVCTIPGLKGTHAQLLVGAGYTTADALASAEPEKLCADVLNFAMTTAGQRLLRNGDPPDIEKIKSWLEAARSIKAA